MKFILTALLVVLAGGCAGGQEVSTLTEADRVTAVPANEFLSSIGVNSSIDTRGESLEKTLESLQYIGARWIRSGYGAKGFSSYDYLIDKGGIRFSMSIGCGESNIEKTLEYARYVKNRGSLIALEGDNEPNNWPVMYKGEKGGGNGTWVPLAQLHADYYAAVKADPVLKDAEVWTLTEAGAQTDDCGLQFTEIPEGYECQMPAGTRYADVVNVHNYFSHPNFAFPKDNQTWVAASPGPDATLDGLYGNNGKMWRNGFPGYSVEELSAMRKVTTETGCTIGGKISEEDQALLYMSCYLSQFKRGWEYTAMYILRDRSDESGNQTFGFFKTDYTPRLSALYLHNLTTILKDESSISNPGTVAYSIPECPETVHDLLLQKNDGTFELVVWGEKYLGGSESIVVNFDRKYSKVRVYDPTVGTEPVETLSGVSGVSLEMSTHPFVLEFKK